MSRDLLIGVDIGGTFTDLVISDQDADRLHRVKVLTTPDDPVCGVMTAVREGLEAVGGGAGEVGRFVHATTLATNLVLERKGARVAYVTTQGFGDMFAMGRGFASGAEMFNLLHKRPEGFVPRDMVFELPERMQANGTALLPLDERGAHEVARAIAQRRPEAVAVNLLHSYLNDSHERRFGEIVREYLPDTYLALSSRIWPERDEYERGATTMVSAYIGPTLAAYLDRLAVRPASPPGLASAGAPPVSRLWTQVVGSGLLLATVSLVLVLLLLVYRSPLVALVGGIHIHLHALADFDQFGNFRVHGRDAGFLVALDIGFSLLHCVAHAHAVAPVHHHLDARLRPMECDFRFRLFGVVDRHRETFWGLNILLSSSCERLAAV